MGCANTKTGSAGAVAAYSAPEEEESGKTATNKMDPPKVVVEGAQVADGVLNGSGDQNGYSAIGEVNGCTDVDDATKNDDDIAGKPAAPSIGEKDGGDSETAENAKNETKGATEKSQNEENNKTEEGGGKSDEAIAECEADAKDDGEAETAPEEGAAATAEEGTKPDSGYETVESREGTADENVE